jgi:hypothetical protein
MQFNKNTDEVLVKVWGLDEETYNRVIEKAEELGVPKAPGWADFSAIEEHCNSHLVIGYDKGEKLLLTSNYLEPRITLTLREFFSLERAVEHPPGYEGFVEGATVYFNNKEDTPPWYTYGKGYEIKEVGFRHTDNMFIYVEDDDGETTVASNKGGRLQDFSLTPPISEKCKPNRAFTVYAHSKVLKKLEVDIRSHLEYLGYQNWGYKASKNHTYFSTCKDGDYLTNWGASVNSDILTLKEFFRLEPEDCRV